MSVLELVVLSAAVALAYLTLVWILSLVLENAGIADIAWGLGVLLLAVLYFTLTDGVTGRRILVLTLTAVWALRLSGYVLLRTIGEKHEDFRYREARQAQGRAFWWRSYFEVFLPQGAGLWLLSMPLLAAMYSHRPDHITPLDAAGAALWIVGFSFEAIADLQLQRFTSDPANQGKVMQTGLWAYSRHPNYFGDALLWWGLFVIAAATPFGWTTVFAPVLMTIILLRISGVAKMEPHLKDHRPGYIEYSSRTSAFVPWPRRATAHPGGRKVVPNG